MSVDVATLSIKVDSSDVKSATKDMSAMEKAGDSLLKKMMGFASFAAFGYLAKQMFDTNAEFQRLNASLITVEGSAERAQKAFKTLQTFATDTPYELTEVTQAFVDLRVRGMDASQRSLTAYGDMASSFGRSLGDTIRAIAGVTVGETEAIKSFGVTAQTTGDTIALTFRGQTEIIKKNSAAVEDYFRKLAEKNYGGGMERQMNTLGGVLSNLKDQIAATFFAIGNSGIGSVVIDSIKGLTQALADVTPALKQFASDAVSSFLAVGRTSSSVVKFLWEWKTVILALAGIAFAATINAWIASIAAMAAPTIQAIALTAALELSTIKYATSLGIAQLAASGFRATMTALLSPAGALTVGIIALTVAMSHYAAENAKIDEQQRKSTAQYENTWGKFYDLVEKTKAMAEERKRIEDSLATGKPVAKEQSKDVADMVEAMRKAGKSEADLKKWVDSYNAEAKALQDAKDKLEAHNKAVREGADEAKRREQERKSFLKGLKEEYETYGMTKDEILKYKAAKLGLAGNPVVDDVLKLRSILDDDKKLKSKEYKYTLPDGTLKTGTMVDADSLRKMEDAREAINDHFEESQGILQREMELYQNGVSVVYPYQQELEQLGQQYEGLVYLRDTNQISQQQFIRGESKLVQDTVNQGLFLRSENGDIWAGMALQVQGFSDNASSAMASFFNGTKTGFSDMISSLLLDMEKLVIKQQLMQPLMNGISAGMGTMGDGGGWGSFAEAFGNAWGGAHANGGSVYSGKINLVGENGPELFVPSSNGSIVPNNALGGVNAPITVIVDAKTGSTEVKGGDGLANMQQIGKLIGVKCREVIVTESRPNGLLAR